MNAQPLPPAYIDQVKALIRCVKEWQRDAPGSVAIRVNVPKTVHLGMTIQQAVHGGYIDMPLGLLDAVIHTKTLDARFHDPTPTMVRMAIDLAKDPNYTEAD